MHHHNTPCRLAIARDPAFRCKKKVRCNGLSGRNNMTAKIRAYLSVELFGASAIVQALIARHQGAVCQMVEVREGYFSSDALAVLDMPFNEANH